jgi:hypothetical protein
MRIAGGGVQQVLIDFESVIQQAKRFVQEHRLAEAHNLIYDAERIAYNAGLHDQATECRKAQSTLRQNQVPALLK